MGIGVNFIGRKIREEIEKFVKLIFEARKDDNRNALLYNAAGEDSVPLNDERLILVKVDGTGKYIAIGVLTLSQGANPGEKIFFARDNKKLDESSIVSKVSMFNNGNIKIDTDTETTGDAKGEYQRIIKGITDITERKDRTYLNEKNVTNTIKENKTSTIEKNKTETIKGNHTRTIEGKKEEMVKGDYNVSVDGNYNLSVKGNVTIKATGAISIESSKDVAVKAPHVGLND